LTLVFRNDPLESLKVSSTFDSIQFVRDYLQKTIEQQLRNLMMDELPAIIHRLSLQLWCPDQAGKDFDAQLGEDSDEAGIDPFESPPLDPVDANGNLLDYSTISELTLNGGGEVQSLFSQRNMLRLGALTDSHRTLSLFTPGIRDVVFRAWSGHGDRSESSTPPLAAPGLTRTHSFPAGSTTTYTFSDSGSAAHGHLPSRPSQVSLNSATTGLALGSGGRVRSGRKKKTRVVNLRRSKSEAGSPATTTENSSEVASVDIPFSEPLVAGSIPEEPEAEAASLDGTIAGHVRFTTADQKAAVPAWQPMVADPRKKSQDFEQLTTALKEYQAASESAPHKYERVPEKAFNKFKATGSPVGGQPSTGSDTSSVILEQAWIMKMAGEIAKRVYDEKNRRQEAWDDREDSPPPAYEAASH